MARKSKDTDKPSENSAAQSKDQSEDAAGDSGLKAEEIEIEDAEVVSETPPETEVDEPQGEDLPEREDSEADAVDEDPKAEIEESSEASRGEGEGDDLEVSDDTTDTVQEEEASEANPEELAAEYEDPTVETESDDVDSKGDVPAEKPAEPEKSTYAALIPLVLGGAAAAFLGFAAASFMHERRSSDGVSPEDNASAIESITSGLATQDGRLAELEAIDHARIAGDAVAPIAAEAQALNARLDDISSQLTALSERVETIAMRPTATGIEADEFDSALSEFRDQLNAAISNAQTEISEARDEATRISEEAFSEEQAAVLRGAWAQVTGALQNGGPFAEPLQTVTEISSLDIPMALLEQSETGVPSLTDVQQAFPDAARAALEASLRANTGEAPMERLTAFLRVQSGVRSLTPREGDDPDAVLSRIEGALRDGDLEAAMGEAQGLPEPGQAALSDWNALATARVEALQAASELSSSLTTN